jgi:hypothetical protein
VSVSPGVQECLSFHSAFHFRFELCSECSSEWGRGDGRNAYVVSGKVSSHGKSHSDDGSFGGGVSQLTRLALVLS